MLVGWPGFVGKNFGSKLLPGFFKKNNNIDQILNI